MPDASEAAVEAMAAALCARRHAVTDKTPCGDCRVDARHALDFLATSEAVRAALVDAPCLLHPGQDRCGGAIRGANVRFHLPCILAALAAGEATCPTS